MMGLTPQQLVVPGHGLPWRQFDDQTGQLRALKGDYYVWRDANGHVLASKSQPAGIEIRLNDGFHPGAATKINFNADGLPVWAPDWLMNAVLNKAGDVRPQVSGAPLFAHLDGTLNIPGRAQGPAKNPTIVWLHGFGGNEKSMAPIVDDMVRAGLPGNVDHVFMAAPIKSIDILKEGGQPKPAWFNYLANREIDWPGIAASQATLGAQMKTLQKKGVASTDVVWAGFSQGASIALGALQHKTFQPAGVMTMSAWLPKGAPINPVLGGKAPPLILMQHGTIDPITRPAHALTTANQFNASGYPVDFRFHPGLGHLMSDDVVKNMIDFSNLVFKGEQR